MASIRSSTRVVLLYYLAIVVFHPAVMTADVTTATIPTTNKNNEKTTSPQTTKILPEISTTGSEAAKITTRASNFTSVASITTQTDEIVKAKVPNPEVGVYVVVVFLVVVGFIVISWLIFVIYRHRGRRLYRQPSRGSSLRTDAPEENNFQNPIQFPSAAYNSAVI